MHLSWYIDQERNSLYRTQATQLSFAGLWKIHVEEAKTVDSSEKMVVTTKSAAEAALFIPA
jgi:hypothetical protein